MSEPELAALADELLELRRAPTAELRSRIRSHPEVVDELKRRSDEFLNSDVRQALQVARRARDAARTTGSAPLLAAGEHAVAKAYHASGRYDRAATAYQVAAAAYRELEDFAAEARTELARVDVLTHLGQHAAAEAAAHRARRTLLRHGHQTGAAKVLVNLANLRHATDRHAAALRLLDRARPVFAADGEALLVAKVDLNRANSYSLLNRFDRSAELYDRARSAFVTLGQHEQVAIADYNHAYDHFLQGRLHEAQRRLASARRTFRRTGARHALGLASLDEAEMALSLSLPDRAAEAAGEARRMFDSLGMTIESSRATLFGAEAARLKGDDVGSAQLVREARAAFARAGHRSGVAASDVAWAGLPFESAARRQVRAQRAAVVLGRLGLRRRESLALALAGSVALERNRLPEARRLLARAAAGAHRRGLPDAEMRAQHSLARTIEAQGHRVIALRHQRRAIAAYERLRAGIGADDDRLAFAADRSVIFEDAVRNALALGRLEEAFEFVERARSRALVDLLSIEPTAATRRAGAALARRLTRLKSTLTGLDRKTRDSERRDGQIPAALTAELHRAVAEHSRAIAGLENHSPRTAYALTGRPIAQLEDVRATLGTDRALLAYFTEGDRIGALLVTDRDVRAWRDLTRHSEVQRAQRAFRFAIGGVRLGGLGAGQRLGTTLTAAATAPLETLRTLLLGPIETTLGDRALVVVPPASMHAIPFHALTRGGQPIIAERDVSVVPSATVFVWAMRRQPRTARALCVALADDSAPAISREAQEVTRALSAETLFGAAATAAELRRKAKLQRVIHIATHGVYESSEPLLSGINLADGRLTVPEIAALELDAALVTLSACDSAVGTPHGDEVVGVVRAFLHAGARSVVASLWAAEDASTAALMGDFYRRLAAGSRVTSALRASALELRRERPHPYYWAPFVTVGGDAPIQA